MAFFAELEKNPKTHIIQQRPQTTKAIVDKKKVMLETSQYLILNYIAELQ